MQYVAIIISVAYILGLAHAYVQSTRIDDTA